MVLPNSQTNVIQTVVCNALEMNRILTFLSFLYFTSVWSQSNSNDAGAPPPLPNSKYALYKYNSELNMEILTYQYFDICDLDNDGTNDLISFIGNGGAHTYYYPEIRLSSSNEIVTFKTFWIDMPYLLRDNKIDEITQFLIVDYDKDGVNEIYLNINNPYGSIPKKMKQKGLTSKSMIIEFENDQLIVKNYKK